MAKSEEPTSLDRSAGVPPAVAGPSRPRTPIWATVVATFLGIGRLHPGPGTWASSTTVLLWAAIAGIHHWWQAVVFGVIVTTTIGLMIAVSPGRRG